MSIRPVDMQIMISKGDEVSKMHNNDSNRPDVQQHRFAEQAAKQSELISKTVIHTKESQNSGIDKDGKGNGSQYSKKRNRKNNDDKEKKEKEKTESQGMFDVLI